MLFAIGDLHLGNAQKKTMDCFGANWKNHQNKIANNWHHQVKEDDTVIIAGDISWAMKTDDFMPDFHFLQSLPGKKVLVGGNHDFWWGSTTQLNLLDPQFFFLKNNFTTYKHIHICGTRGWLCENDTEFTPHDKKILKRETQRLQLSLEAAMSNGAKEILVVFHFPPKNDKGEPSALSQMLSHYPIKTVVYGHLHGEKAFSRKIKNKPNDISYRLVSCDFLDFNLLKLL